jgi:hypothetical protein
MRSRFLSSLLANIANNFFKAVMARLYHIACSVYLSVVELAVLVVTAAGTGDF